MQSPAKVALVLALVAAAFLAGTWYSHRNAPTAATTAAPSVLYYSCPMHPQYRSDRPGDCPSCGMRLEPVHANQVGNSPVKPPSARLSGALQVSQERQQLLGVRLAPVEKVPGSHRVRTTGRIAADETRIYRVNATVDGWIQQLGLATTGSLVRKDEVLAAYYAPEFLSAQQAYLYALSAMDRFQANEKETPEQIRVTQMNIQQAKDSLLTLGMSELQANEIAKTREVTQRIRILSPVTGLILTRDVSPGQRFQRGAELYRVADLSRVWVLADLFEDEADYVRPGQEATVRYRKRPHTARASDVPPQFDPATRTLKARFEFDNPGYTLRPDMFVDVEFDVSLPRAISVPADAVVDSGQEQTVFITKGDGYFEPRAVEVGWRFGDRVEIRKGVSVGEQIVVSGAFLLDSESRMRAAWEPDKGTSRHGDKGTRQQGGDE